MKCSKCKRNLIDNKDIKAKGNWEYVAGLACTIFGGPVVTALGIFTLGGKLYDRFIKDEIEVKCPHCGATLTLTRKEYKELKESDRETYFFVKLTPIPYECIIVWT